MSRKSALPARPAYVVTATREGRWWVLDVEGIGTTNVRRLTEAEEWVRDLIEAMTDAPVPAETPVTIRLAGEDGSTIAET
ncbi:MAG: hypothetical protein FWD74_06280, partial [Actinomycetia bacterium]|nr:hypothetical protein [Actinomycetes bacterium]